MPLDFEFAGDNLPREISFADEIGDDVNFVLFDHWPDLSKTGLFFPEGAVHAAECTCSNDRLGVVPGRLGGIGIFGGTVSEDEKGAVGFANLHQRNLRKPVAIGMKGRVKDCGII